MAGRRVDSARGGVSPKNYSVGAKVEYYSKSYDEWIPALVGAVRADGNVKLLHDDGAVLKEQADPSQIRPATGSSEGQDASPPSAGRPPRVSPPPGAGALKRQPSNPAPVGRGNRAPSPGPGAVRGSAAVPKIAASPSRAGVGGQPSSARGAAPAKDAGGGDLASTINAKRLYVGDRIKIKESGREGEVMYVGTPSFSSKEIVGMRLDEKRSKSDCDGKAPNGERLFRCPAGYGIFLPSEDVEVLPRGEADEFPSIPAPEGDINFVAALGELTGLTTAKQQLARIRQLVEVQKKREAIGVHGGKPLHFIFRGGRGTGMSTVGKNLAHLLRDMGVIESGQLVEVSRKEVLSTCGGHGDAEKQMSKVWKSSAGGVLLINDIQLFQDRERSRGDEAGVEASDWLAKQLEAMQKRCSGENALPCWPQPVVVIITAPMDAVLPDPLQRLSVQTVDFPDYSHQELAEIMLQLVSKRKFTLSPELTSECLVPHIRDASLRAESNSEKNLALLQRLLDEAIARQTERVWTTETVSLQGLTTLVEADFVDSLSPSRDETMKACLAKLDGVVGLAGVKSFIHSLYAQLKTEMERREAGLKGSAGAGTLHMIFTGNPGTGKTTVARIVAELLTAMGLLRKGHLVEADRASLVAGYSGQTALKTRQVVEQAMGGVLFVDEAYALISEDGKDSFGKEALDTLIKMIEDRRQDLVVILAGYPDEMERLMAANPGVRSRFPVVVQFEDYSESELLQIAERMLLDDILVLSHSATAALQGLLHAVVEGKSGRENGNGRAVRNILEQAKRKMAVRLQDEGVGAQRSKAELCTLEAADFG